MTVTSASPQPMPGVPRPPIAVDAIDVTQPFQDLQLGRSRGGDPYQALALFVRCAAQPLGWTVVSVPASQTVPATLVEQACRSQVASPAMQRHSGAPETESLADAALKPKRHAQVAPDGRRGDEALISVVVPTCAAADRILSCVRAVLAHAEPPLEVIVVENRPGPGSSVRVNLLDAFGHDTRLRYAEEPLQGLSNARNAGLDRARGGLVAFVDDDVIVDEHWLSSLRGAHATHPDVACITGLILPLELETEAQILIERFSALGKGFRARRFSLDASREDLPLFPYTAGHFGSGANMAFSRSVLRALGGFDPILGTGTPGRGGEDLDVYIRLILAGHTVLYEPRALAWHRHPDTIERLDRHAFSYGVGLGAMVTKHLLTGGERRRLVRLIPGGTRYLFDARSRKNVTKGQGFPPRLERRERLGILYGPGAYLHSRQHARRVGVRQPNRRVFSGQLELAEPVEARHQFGDPDPVRSGPFEEARLLVRVLGEPIGFVSVPVTEGALERASVMKQIAQRFGDRAEQALRSRGLPGLLELDGHRTGAPAPDWWRDSPVEVTVAVCTRDRAEDLRACLGWLRELRHPRLELLIVDNAPGTETTQRLADELAREDERIRYVRENRPGLACARNRALREARGELIAFTDDDVRVDPLWVKGIIRGFSRRADVTCVTGLVASVRLERPTEQYFDRRVWWSSNCEHRIYTLTRRDADSRLYPYTAGAFGTGANFAFRSDSLRALGGFDESLGAGAPTAGGEDLDVFVRILRAGDAISYEPAALVWHEHRADQHSARAQMYGYGKGLSAYFCKYLLSSSCRGELLHGALPVVCHLAALRARSKEAGENAGVSRGLALAELRGLLVGPFAYLYARSRQSREHLELVAP